MEKILTKVSPKSLNRNFHFSFAFIAVGDLLGRILQNQWMDYFFKPLIVLWLMVYFYVRIGGCPNRFTLFILVALFFGWQGDIALMFGSPAFFMAGLCSFLIGHIFYMLAYYESVKQSDKKSILLKKPYLVIPFLVLIAAMYLPMQASLAEKGLEIPVLIYSFMLNLMGIFALNRYGRVPIESFRPVFFGAILFIISDALIAFNTFLSPFPLAGLWIMLTYIAAQYLIVQGSIKQVEAGQKN